MQITVFPVFLFFALIHHIVANARLTQTPPGRSYAVVGDTVKFNWNYTVVNKEVDFGHYVSSPVWYYYNPDGRTKSVIAVDDGLRGWKWTISRRTCPPRLLYPTVRVSKESVATLVISNVTKNDSGWYEISLVLRISPSITNKVELIVIGKYNRFKKVPPSLLFVTKGKTARFEWNYSYDNRNNEFQEDSPVWGYINQENQWTTIALGKKSQGQGWEVALNTTTCPARLLNPTRVHVEPLATLVIRSVTIADNGTYGCSLKLKWGPPVTNTVQLVVTDYPEITFPITLSSMIIQEGSQLDIPCLSRGVPTPNVTWLRMTRNSKSFMSKGIGNATLRIQGINRNQSGIYECYATNNPNEVPVLTKIDIIVVYKPVIDNRLSSGNNVSSILGDTIHLRCTARGVPLPNITWYTADGKIFLTGKTSYPGGSELVLTTTRKQDYGMYRCRAENTVGVAWHNITVMQICQCIGNYQKYKRSLGSSSSIINEPVIFVIWLTVILVSGVVNSLLLIYIKFGKHQKCKGVPRNEIHCQNKRLQREPYSTKRNRRQCFNHSNKL